MTESNLFEPEYEAMKREDLERLQLSLLQQVVETCFQKSGMYRDKFDASGVKPSDIQTLKDIKKLPFTTKDDLRPRYPLDGLTVVPGEDIVRLHMTSGTTGKPSISPLTANDLQLMTRLVARIFTAGGCRKKDKFQVLWGYGLFLGGLAVGGAIEAIGMQHIPTGSATPSARQLELMQDLQPTVIGSTPSFLRHLTEVAKEQDINVGELGIETIFLGAEPSSAQMREKIRQVWNADVFDFGGTCELLHIWHECSAHKGLHMAEDAVIFEVIDPDTGEDVPPGERGELVVTTLLKEAMPLIRWRTRDITSIVMDEPCTCGRTSRQIDHLSGRVDDMIKVKGVCVFPSQIEGILKGIPEVNESEFQIVVSTTKMYTDTLTVQVEVPDEMAGNADVIALKIENEVKNKIAISSQIKLVKEGTMPRFIHKAKRVVDFRDIENQG
jgi:phenylacetate-CoA ligase